jgi:hypothetical protein
MVFLERWFMRLIKGFLAGPAVAGILAMMPAAAFAHGGGGQGGEHAFVGGGGHAFSGFTGRGFSPGFRAMRVFSSGRFSGRGDDGRFRAGGRGRDFAFHDGRFHNRFFAHDRFFRRDRFLVHDRFFRHHHRFVSNLAFVGFGFPDWYSNYDDSYSDDYPNNDGEPGYDGQYFDESSVPTQSELARRANYLASLEGISGFGNPLAVGSSNDRGSYRSTSAAERDMNVVREPNESTGAKADPVKLVTPDPNTQGGTFANLILVGWLNDGGNYVIFVQNTETKKLQKVTSEPNKDHFRIIELRQNADPKLVEAVISNGTDQGTVKVAKRD